VQFAERVFGKVQRSTYRARSREGTQRPRLEFTLIEDVHHQRGAGHRQPRVEEPRNRRKGKIERAQPLVEVLRGVARDFGHRV